MNRRLTILKESCLRAMARGMLERHADGWRPVDGRPGSWNTHTVTWLAQIGYCRIIPQTARPLAKILAAGKGALACIDGVEDAA